MDIKTVFKNSLAILKADIKGTLQDRYVWILSGIYSLLFSPTILAMNDVPLSLVSSLEMDHASMLEAALKTLEWKTLYNQMASYHSAHYGWTYFFFSFWILSPVKLITWIVNADPYFSIFIGLKILHFIYGLLAGISFYCLMNKFSGRFYSLTFSLILLLASPLTRFLYLFHPENMGILFLNLGCIYIICLFKQKSDRKDILFAYYEISLVLLVFSTLSKPTFLPITAPLYLALLAIYLQKLKQPASIFHKILMSSRLFTGSLLSSVILFFLINPFFFIYLNRAIRIQKENAAAMHSSIYCIPTWHEGLAAWTLAIYRNPLMLASILSLLVTLISLLWDRHLNKFLKIILLFIQFSVLLNIFLSVFSLRLFISLNYLIPILPLLLISLWLAMSKLKEIVFLPKQIRNMLPLAICVMLSYVGLRDNLNNLISFSQYKKNISYEVFSYIRNNIPNGAVIVHDHCVAIPTDKEIRSYHYWTYPDDFFRSIDADYLIFNPEYKTNGIRHEKLVLLMEIVRKGPYKKIDSIENIEVWKRLITP